jgi:hypothetical protein
MSLLSYVGVFFTIITLLTSVLLTGPNFIHAQLSGTNTTTSHKIGVKITSPKANQTVPLGELSIFGTSSDTQEANCQVYVDWNDTKPMQNVTGIGQGGPKDYSNWTFTYTKKYQLIKEGTNELTSKITCSDASGSGNVTSKFYSINITGMVNPTVTNIPTSSGQINSTNYTKGIQNVGYHSILPQYSNTSTNDISDTDINNENTTPQTTTYAAAVNDNPSDQLDDKLDGSSSLSSSTSNQDHSSHDYNSISVSKSGDKGDNEKSSDKKKGHDIIQFKTIKHVKSSNVKTVKHGFNDFKNNEFNGDDLSTYIHNLVREKLKKVYLQLLD